MDSGSIDMAEWKLVVKCLRYFCWFLKTRWDHHNRTINHLIDWKLVEGRCPQVDLHLGPIYQSYNNLSDYFVGTKFDFSVELDNFFRSHVVLFNNEAELIHEFTPTLWTSKTIPDALGMELFEAFKGNSVKSRLGADGEGGDVLWLDPGPGEQGALFISQVGLQPGVADDQTRYGEAETEKPSNKSNMHAGNVK